MRSKGNLGELHATQFLREKGYQILERNWIFNKAEIDIIAKHENQLIIVEVKSRNSTQFGSPTEAITNKKTQLLIGAAEAYISKNELDCDTRFDVICVVFNTPIFIEHIQNAFTPLW